MLLLLLVNFTIGSRLELIYISHLLGFQLLVLPPDIIVVLPLIVFPVVSKVFETFVKNSLLIT